MLLLEKQCLPCVMRLVKTMRIVLAPCSGILPMRACWHPTPRGSSGSLHLAWCTFRASPCRSCVASRRCAGEGVAEFPRRHTIAPPAGGQVAAASIPIDHIDAVGLCRLHPWLVRDVGNGGSGGGGSDRPRAWHPPE
eukprot:scaffold118892_cov32-Tisochrysis_lutea.AAC.1